MHDTKSPGAILHSMAYREVFAAEQLSNRSNGVVDGVWIAGTRVRDGSVARPAFGQTPLTRPLTCAGR